MLIWVGCYETSHYQKPLSAKEIVTEVLKGSHDIAAVVPPVTVPQAHIPRYLFLQRINHCHQLEKHYIAATKLRLQKFPTVVRKKIRMK
jgi:hypothetical protein